MRAVDLIRRKRDGEALSAAEIRWFVQGVTDGSWPDAQVAALLMAIVWRGMTIEEAAELTDAMVASGRRLDLSGRTTPAVDKHSTGGVGDKISLVLAPLAAACGAAVPMMSGRGLGHTGGTLDKLDAIAGFRTRLSLDEARGILDRVGCVMMAPTEDVAPADRRLYALRDVTATVESRPLISASILSKKIAEGIGALVLDVKVGRGAFLQTDAEARELATWLARIAGRHGIATEAILTSMDAPLGRAVGNASEVIEALETLKGRGPADVETLSVHLTARMLVLSGVVSDASEAERGARGALEDGRALERFRLLIEAQGGDPRVVDDYTRLPVAPREATVPAPADGVVRGLHAGRIGRAAAGLGAGRDRVEAAVDPGVGIAIEAPVGTPVRRGEPVLRVRYADEARWAGMRDLLAAAVEIGDTPPVVPPLIRETIGADTPAR